MYSPVDNAIARMWEGYSEPLSLADIAKSAILSRFHFCRVFREATGVTPGRFLSAVRIYQAKRMLVSTSLSVTEISLAVGYNSLGSFTNRFTESVGASPSRFRRIWRQGIAEPCRPVPAPSGTVAGHVTLPDEFAAARVFIGAFGTPIVQRRPPAWTIVDARPGDPVPYRLPAVPAGEWFIRAVATADSAEREPWTRRSLLVGGQGSVVVTEGLMVSTDLGLRPRRPADLPILFAVPDLERHDIGHPGDPAAAARPEPTVAIAPPALVAVQGQRAA